MDKETDRESRREATRAEARARVEEGVQERLLARRAREREEAKTAGRAQRGFFTGRGSKRDADDDVGTADNTGFFGARKSRRDAGTRDRPCPDLQYARLSEVPRRDNDFSPRSC